MKKILLPILGLLAINFAGANAQEYAVKQNKFKDNWFLEAKVGASMSLASDWNFDSALKDVTSPYVGLSFGKYFSPLIGARIEVGGWQLKNKFNMQGLTADPLKSNFIQTNFDLMFNLMNAFGKVKVDRTFDLYGIMGVGYMRHLGFVNGVEDYGYASDDMSGSKNYVNTKLALQGQFHVSKAVDINLEVSANFITNSFIASSRKFTGYVNAMAGVAYKFKKRGFELGEVVEPGLVASLNDEINKQRGIVADNEKEINNLKNQIKDYQDENALLNQKLKDSKTNTSNVTKNEIVITYRIGKTDVSKEQLVSIYNVAQMLKENPNATVEINAYADAKTGSAKRNKYLTEKRAETIVKILTENYGIAENRISSKAYGSDSQIYDNNDWNRVAVVIVK